MALYTGSGSKSWFAIGRNKVRGTKITEFDAPSGDGSSRTAGMTQKRFPFSEFNINEIADAIDSNLITGFGSRAAQVFGRYSAGGRIVTGIIPEDIIHFMMGILNLDTRPDGTLMANLNSKDTPDDTLIPAGHSVGSNYTPGNDGENKINASSPPSRLKFEFSAVPTAGTVTIKGFRKIGRADVDRFPITETATPRAISFTSKNYFQEITSITFDGITPGNATVVVTWGSNTWQHEAKFSTAASEFPGWTVQGSDGGQPFVAEDITPVRMDLSIGTGGVTNTMEVVGTRKDELRTIATAENEVYVFPESELKEHFPLGSTRQQPVWGSSFLYGDTIVKATGIEIGINLNLGPDDAFDGSRFITDITSQGNREIDFNPTIRFISGTQASDTFARWQNIYRNDERTKLVFRGYNYYGNGARELIEIECPSSQLITNEINTTGAGPIDRRLAFIGQPTGTETSEVIVRVQTQSEFTEGE